MGIWRAKKIWGYDNGNIFVQVLVSSGRNELLGVWKSAKNNSKFSSTRFAQTVSNF